MTEEEKEIYQKACSDLEENQGKIRKYERKQKREKDLNTVWWKEYKKGDFGCLLGPYYFPKKYREFREITIGATNLVGETFNKTFDCEKCFSLLGKLLSNSEDIVTERVQQEFSEIIRTFTECECGRCIVEIEVLAKQGDDGMPGGMAWHLL